MGEKSIGGSAQLAKLGALDYHTHLIHGNSDHLETHWLHPFSNVHSFVRGARR